MNHARGMHIKPPERSYFYLPELASLWGMTSYDVIHLVEDGDLRVSIVRNSAQLWRGTLTEKSEITDIDRKNEDCLEFPADLEFYGEEMWALPMEGFTVGGIFPLYVADAQRILRDQTGIVRFIDTPPEFLLSCTFFRDPGEQVTASQIVVSTAQKLAFEDEHGVQESATTAVRRRASSFIEKAALRIARRLS